MVGAVCTFEIFSWAAGAEVWLASSYCWGRSPTCCKRCHMISFCRVPLENKHVSTTTKYPPEPNWLHAVFKCEDISLKIMPQGFVTNSYSFTGQGAIVDLEPFGVWNRIRWLWAVDHRRWRLWRGDFEPWMLNSGTDIWIACTQMMIKSWKYVEVTCLQRRASG